MHIMYREDVKYLHRIFRFVFIVVENIQPKYPVVFMSVVIFLSIFCYNHHNHSGRSASKGYRSRSSPSLCERFSHLSFWFIYYS